MQAKQIAAILWITIIIMIMATWLSGCATQRKADKFYHKHPEKLAQSCAEHFPVKDSVSVHDSVHYDTLWKDGEPVFIHDTVFYRGDTVVKVITQKCPQSQTVTKTIVHDSIVYRRDLAREAVLNFRIDSLNKVISALRSDNEKKAATIVEKEKTLEWWRRIAIIESIFIIGFLAIKIFKVPIPFVKV